MRSFGPVALNKASSNRKSFLACNALFSRQARETSQHNGEKTIKEENPSGCQQPRGGIRGACFGSRSQKHGHSDRSRRGRFEHQPARDGCKESHGTRHSESIEGAERKQAEGLRGHVRPPRCHASNAIFSLGKRKHELENGASAKRSHDAFQSGKVFALQGCAKGAETS